ncbi:hypothetical protein [Fluviicola sp.]|uniref:hypothetical protein n=1 Tax=Fluviicola sp. TaxID=1917219 RepID=UPI0031D65D56
MKIIILFIFGLSVSNLLAQSDIINLSEISANSDIIISEPSNKIVKGYFKKRNCIFSMKLFDPESESFKLVFTSLNLSHDCWNPETSDEVYLKMLFSELEIVCENLKLNKEIWMLLDESIKSKNYEFNESLGDVTLITGNDNYSEVSVRINHFQFYGFTFDFLVRK